MLVGTKLDLADRHPQLRQVSKEEVQALASARNITVTMETSAKENTNIDACFNTMAKTLMTSQVGLRSSLSGSNVSTEVGNTRPVETSRCPC